MMAPDFSQKRPVCLNHTETPRGHVTVMPGSTVMLVKL